MFRPTHADKNYNVNDYYQIKLLTTLWSCKETIYKWWGNGKVDFKKMIAIDYFKLEKKYLPKIYFKKFS